MLLLIFFNPNFAMNHHPNNSGIGNTHVDNTYFESDKFHSSYVTLTVVILPMDYKSSFAQTLFITGKETSLKQVFSRNPEYWKIAFPGHTSQETHFLTVYRKTLDSIEGYSGKQLHILLLKSHMKSKRNPNALPLEQFCSTQFFGPLVVSLSLMEPPYSLYSFKISDIQILENINRLRGNNKPGPMPAPKTPIKPQSSSLIKTDSSSVSNLEKSYCEMTAETFFMYRFKTEYCPNIKKNHNWNTCIYAHWIYDYRRSPDKYQYIAEICPLVDSNRGGVCTNNEKCGYAHSVLEKEYHPSRYKVFACENQKNGTCNRKNFCPLYHSPQEQRDPITLHISDSQTQTFLSYAEPKVHCINIITNYVDSVLTHKSGGKAHFKWQYISLKRGTNRNCRTLSEISQDSPKHNTRSSSLGVPKDYFALFSNGEDLEPQKSSSGFVAVNTGPTGRIFIDNQYVDNAEAISSVEEIGTSSRKRMVMICDSICSSGSTKIRNKSLIARKSVV